MNKAASIVRISASEAIFLIFQDPANRMEVSVSGEKINSICLVRIFRARYLKVIL